LRDAEDGGVSDEEEDSANVHIPSYASLEELRKGEYNIIYAHPETLLNNRSIASLLRSKLYQQRVCAVVIDEVHMVSEW
jgi:superfamily II DNA helicase RecQ